MTAQKKKQTQKTRRKKNGNLLCKGDDRALYSMPRWSSTSHRLPGKGRRMGPIMGHTMHYRHKISSSTSRKPYALEEACTVWEGVLIDQKEESTSTDMPLGTAIHNIEITLGKGGQLVRAAGAVAKLIAKEGKSATLKLPSGEVRLISKNCSATVGQVGNVGVNQKSLGRAGSKRWLGKRPVVRGVVMNPVDHPQGGGEGRAPIGRLIPLRSRAESLKFSFLHRAWTMSPEQSQYIWRKTIPHIEVGMGSGVFTSHRSARFVLISD
ncbi:hypothetical protein TEA_004512 [Camellia sinensis var. sinensis]|uniref:Large ribosomal subunit protein uL2 C-terminal domain-containing protein n=1 Tax=Camellia sinensis var. sinensis TaxID=542762 RepID=A0A4S4EAK8_CAMSN|nr:hypothetical protein TEA_004512 [Camellia sinensis var. sinensis]